jgi:hypothetical protein
LARVLTDSWSATYRRFQHGQSLCLIVRLDHFTHLSALDAIGDTAKAADRRNLFERVIYRCVIGSQAYGLASEVSEIDRRGYLGLTLKK